MNISKRQIKPSRRDQTNFKQKIIKRQSHNVKYMNRAIETKRRQLRKYKYEICKKKYKKNAKLRDHRHTHVKSCATIEVEYGNNWQSGSNMYYVKP